MNNRTKTGLEILEAALLLGILGNALLRATPWGFNVLLFIGALVMGMLAITLRKRHELWDNENLWLNAALIVFAVCFAWRDSIALKIFDALLILAILSIIAWRGQGVQAHLSSLTSYLGGAILSGFSAAFGPLFLLFNDVQWKTIPRNGWTKHLIAVLRGVAIAAPILFVFGALFMAADAVYEGIIKNTFKIDPEILFSHIMLTGFLAWIVAGYLRGSLLSEDLVSLFSQNTNAATPVQTLDLNQNEPNKEFVSVTEEPRADTDAPKTAEPKPSTSGFFSLGIIETSVVLGLINLLFLSFVIVQIPYLFGGMDLVQNTADLKLATYARRGFGELVTVAALVLPILLASHWLVKKDNPLNEKIFGVLAGIQIGLLFVIMYSAVQRMLLLMSNLGYGYSELRIYPLAFMAWLALVFVWLGLTVLRGQRRRFAWGALWAAIGIVFSLHVINPDNLIVNGNTRLMVNDNRSYDIQYMKELSDDAVPALANALPFMTFEQQCVTKREFNRRLERDSYTDFRTWSYSRLMARKTLWQLQQSDSLNIEGCPAPTRNYSRGLD